MASIYLRSYPSKKAGVKPKKVWWIKWYELDGEGNLIPQRESLKTSNKRIAEREKQAREAKLLKRHRLAPQELNARCEDFWTAYDEWLHVHRGNSTIELHTRFWGQLMEHTAAKRLGDVLPADIESYKRWRIRVGNSQQTVNNALKDLQAIFNRAIEQGHFTGANPVKGIERFKLKKPLITYHTEEDAMRLLGTVAMENPTRDQRNLEWVVLLGIWGGFRKTCIAHARWEWFKFRKRPSIEIREFPGFTLKTRDERTLPMSRRIYDALYPHRQKEGFVFESDRTSAGKSIYRFEPRKSLTAALTRADLEIDDPFQKLRRTFGSIHVQHGKSYEIVSQWMGNSVKVVERYYAGIKPHDEDIDVF